jgi:chemotaxis protein MotB
MFANGSAEPTPGLVRALDKITPLISQYRGQLIVRGHTDNRAYRSADYDNWRLSTARAHMAYHMLVRGGLDAKRIERIEGYADRRPKIQNDPAAPQNRRIELLIRAPMP